jgi:acyl-CoA dehydrogenase
MAEGEGSLLSLSPQSMSSPTDLSPATRKLRDDVREFLGCGLEAGAFVPRIDGWLSGWNPEFSRALGARGWLGITLPVEFGGRGLSFIDRFVVTEELLAAGAPVAAHWFADRQTAPSILRYGTQQQRTRFLPEIAGGRCHFAVGLSEPDSGSDLASVRTRGEKVPGGWRLYGEKLWTSGAHLSHAVTVLARTDGPHARDKRSHEGLTQFIVELPADSLDIQPIHTLDGEHHFNSLSFDGVYVPDELVLGSVGHGWTQVIQELAHERSGPERFLSTFPLISALTRELRAASAARAGASAVDGLVEYELGAMVARLWGLRQLSLSVAATMSPDKPPPVTAALAKDLGTVFEQGSVETARVITAASGLQSEEVARLVAEAVAHAPGFTLRGGTTEILRGIVARSLGMR